MKHVEWLARNAVTAAAVTTAVALIAPLVSLGAIALGMGWRLSHEPEHWAAWIPALAATWGALVTAGYFIITAAVFHMTARQAEAAAQQAEAAADAAQQSAKESSMNAAALRGTIAMQRLERRRWWEPLRSALRDTAQSVALLIEKADLDATGGFLRTGAPANGWWDARIAAQWGNAEWLIPAARSEFDDAKVEIQKLDRLVRGLLNQGSRPTQLQQELPKIVAVARSLHEHLVKLAARVDEAAHFDE